MKKSLLAFFALVGMIGMTSVASALPLQEVFFGGPSDRNYLEMRSGASVKLSFDLVGTTPYATLDETGYVASDYQIESAKLQFEFSSADWWPEVVRVKTDISDGDTLLAQEWYWLGGGSWFGSASRGGRDYITLSIDLARLGVLEYLQDGRLATIVLVPDFCWDWNDIRLDQAMLLAEATPLNGIGTAQVPEPATILMFGAGLIGLVGLGRYKFVKRDKNDEV